MAEEGEIARLLEEFEVLRSSIPASRCPVWLRSGEVLRRISHGDSVTTLSEKCEQLIGTQKLLREILLQMVIEDLEPLIGDIKTQEDLEGLTGDKRVLKEKVERLIDAVKLLTGSMAQLVEIKMSVDAIQLQQSRRSRALIIFNLAMAIYLTISGPFWGTRA